MGAYRTLDDLKVEGKRVLLRLDLNVPVQDGRVGDMTRIERVLPTLRELMAKQARVVVLSHLGRPKGKRDPALSLAPVARALAEALGSEIAFAEDCVGPAAETAVAVLKPGQAAMLENLRFHAGEEANDADFTAELAALGEVYVNDAFACAHRAHASTEGLAHRLPAAAGRAMMTELAALEAALSKPEHPLLAIVGGAKVSTKIEVLGHLIEKVDHLAIGGAMANTFLLATGLGVGRSLREPELVDTAREILARAEGAGCEIVLPRDVVVAHELKAGIDVATVVAERVPEEMMILDVGRRTVLDVAERLRGARTLIWNGPMGAFETPPFDEASNELARLAAVLTREGHLLSVAGGGDTVAALAHAGVADAFSYVSTAGGAFLEWLEGKALPGVEALRA